MDCEMLFITVSVNLATASVRFTKWAIPYSQNVASNSWDYRLWPELRQDEIRPEHGKGNYIVISWRITQWTRKTTMPTED
jgi:hypothetical protein